jgi:hypothetical protein
MAKTNSGGFGNSTWWWWWNVKIWVKKKMLKNQRGGSTFKYGMRMGDMFTGRRKKRQRGSGFGSWMERNMFGVK